MEHAARLPLDTGEMNVHHLDAMQQRLQGVNSNRRRRCVIPPDKVDGAPPVVASGRRHIPNWLAKADDDDSAFHGCDELKLPLCHQASEVTRKKFWGRHDGQELARNGWVGWQCGGPRLQKWP
jgi:hypothetical protein